MARFQTRNWWQQWDDAMNYIYFLEKTSSRWTNGSRMRCHWLWLMREGENHSTRKKNQGKNRRRVKRGRTSTVYLPFGITTSPFHFTCYIVWTSPCSKITFFFPIFLKPFACEFSGVVTSPQNWGDISPKSTVAISPVLINNRQLIIFVRVVRYFLGSHIIVGPERYYCWAQKYLMQKHSRQAWGTQLCSPIHIKSLELLILALKNIISPS